VSIHGHAERAEQSLDKVLIDSLICQAHVGVPLKERNRRQRVLIDLELLLNLKPAGRTDRVDQTIDYAAVAELVKDVVEGRSFRLVEAMAEAVAQRVVHRFKPAQVVVRIRKFSVPGVGSVGVEIIRGKLRTKQRFPRTGPR